MKNIKNYGEFVKENFLLEGKEHVFANRVVRLAQALLTDEEQDNQSLYEKIMGWAIKYYDDNVFGREISESDCENFIASLTPLLNKWRGAGVSDDDDEE